MKLFCWLGRHKYVGGPTYIRGEYQKVICLICHRVWMLSHTYRDLVLWDSDIGYAVKELKDAAPTD